MTAGHERKDVVAHRNLFVKNMEMMLRRTTRAVFDDQTDTWRMVRPELKEGEKEVVIINQDECLCFENDDSGKD